MNGSTDPYLQTTGDVKRGLLRIYFGYAAGVGKTFAMLDDAHVAKNDGIDVVAGYIEPHLRPDTSALVDGLEVLPQLTIHYRGVTLEEFDLDGALQRKPQLILVDELAHTNPEGSRHKKRYQDIEELLHAGIDVFTTVNVQHLESLNDIVAAITGVSVQERIPDSVFDSADQIELVDIEPEDLIERLAKGKIYQEAKIERALSNFFTKDKLIALREIALRRTADQVNRSAQQSEQQLNQPQTIAKEHILVCLSSALTNTKAIRTAARLAEAFHGRFTALYVETSDAQALNEKNKTQLRENLRLAEQLGAQIATMSGDDIPEQIAEYANISHVSKIVVGRSRRTHRHWRNSNFVDRLTSSAPHIDIYIIPDNQSNHSVKGLPKPAMNKVSLRDIALSIGILLLCTGLGLLFFSLGLSEANIITLFILGVLLNATLAKGQIYSILTSIFSVLIFNFFFTEPRFSLQVDAPGYMITLFVMLIAALITSTLTKRVKQQALQSAQKAYRTDVLLETSRKLQQVRDQTEILSETAQQLVKLLDRSIIFYTPEGSTLSQPLVFSSDETIDLSPCISADEQAVAQWVYKNNKHAGAGTNTLSGSKCLYLAVRGTDSVVAVAAIVITKQAPLGIFEKSLMLAMLGECSLALEKEKLNDTKKEISIQIQQEQLRANLLRAISHDLRTPLTSISGNSGILMKNSSVLDEKQKQSLYSDIYDDSIWLINLVENLLAITRIDNSSLNLKLQPELLEEVISEALLHINRNSRDHSIEVQIENEFLMAKMDSRLIIQVIINLIDNAIAYTPKGSHITISAKEQASFILVQIADDGDGIADDVKPRIFEMFYTGNNLHGDGRRGLGLGLYLCKSIIEAHGGTIDVNDHAPHGTVFSFTLQKEEVNIHE